MLFNQCSEWDTVFIRYNVPIANVYNRCFFPYKSLAGLSLSLFINVARCWIIKTGKATKQRNQWKSSKSHYRDHVGLYRCVMVGGKRGFLLATVLLDWLDFFFRLTIFSVLDCFHVCTCLPLSVSLSANFPLSFHLFISRARACVCTCAHDCTTSSSHYLCLLKVQSKP